MKSLVLFNNKGGVGKTTLTFNLAHMAARLGLRTVLLDLDPQCNLSSLALDEVELDEVWNQSTDPGGTIARCVELVRMGRGQLRPPSLRVVLEGSLWLLPGDLSLSWFEQKLAEEWGKVFQARNEQALDVTTAFHETAILAANAVGAELVLIDVGPSLGALNRSALLACDHVVVPLAADLFSLQGMKNIGPTLKEWRDEWLNVRRRHMKGRPQAQQPFRRFTPLGYVIQQHMVREGMPVAAWRRWADQIPAVFREEVLGEKPLKNQIDTDSDRNCLAQLRHFASLVPLAQVARKPMFDLKQADGISGGQARLVAECRQAFEALTRKILGGMGVTLPT